MQAIIKHMSQLSWLYSISICSQKSEHHFSVKVCFLFHHVHNVLWAFTTLVQFLVFNFIFFIAFDKCLFLHPKMQNRKQEVVNY